MSDYLRPVSDELPTRKFGPWAVEKLYYLTEYIARFSVAMHNKPWRSRRYIDLFAGTGKLYIEEKDTYILGSPLLALTAPQPFTECVFVEYNQDNLNALKKRCGAVVTTTTIHYHNGDSNVYVQQLVARIQAEDQKHRDKWSSLNLAFLDPDGLELTWATVAKLAQVKKMDLIIHYSQGGLNRTMRKYFASDDETIVDRFFGDTMWREIYKRHKIDRKQPDFLHRALIDYYKSKLKKLGYVGVLSEDETGIEPLIRNKKRNAPLYRLLFASKHELGHKFWKSSTRQTPFGQKRLF